MSELVVSPRAGLDIEEIWDYSADHWDTAQADRYIRNLQQAMITLAAEPDKGRVCHDIRAGYRKYAVSSHFIFYRTTDMGIDVVRILHQRMNVESRL